MTFILRIDFGFVLSVSASTQRSYSKCCAGYMISFPRGEAAHEKAAAGGVASDRSVLNGCSGGKEKFRRSFLPQESPDRSQYQRAPLKACCGCGQVVRGSRHLSPWAGCSLGIPRRVDGLAAGSFSPFTLYWLAAASWATRFPCESKELSGASRIGCCDSAQIFENHFGEGYNRPRGCAF